MDLYYSAEKSIQIIISLLKKHNIKKIIASPGSTNITFVGSVMNDKWFEIYSCIDERSAAYMACGLSEESGEPVVISCTGATASRNYIPGLTEAFYDKLPILAITSTQGNQRIGNLVPQVVDRKVIQNDIAVLSEYIPLTKKPEDEWSNIVKINRALLALRHRSGGPVHLDVQTEYNEDFSVKTLPDIRAIYRISLLDPQTNPGNYFPVIKNYENIGIFIGRHKIFSEEEIHAIDQFCENYNAVAFCDHTSGYKGKYKILYPLIGTQKLNIPKIGKMDLMIHLGEISGAYVYIQPTEVWRVNEDGEIKDYFKKLTRVFEMQSIDFFNHYNANSNSKRDISYYNECKLFETTLRSKINLDSIPFSNIWVAGITASKIPDNSVVHLGILNTLRSWNLFYFKENVVSSCNTGGFGIDGIISTLVGASYAKENKLFFAILGDLAFFYDINSLGNRHIKNNLRIMLINNGLGMEFKNYDNFASNFGDETDKYIAAGGHYNNPNKKLIKHFAEDLGYVYLKAENKNEYMENLKCFISPLSKDSKPIIFEIFVDQINENEAKRILNTLDIDPNMAVKSKVREILGHNTVKKVKKLIGRK